MAMTTATQAEREVIELLGRQPAPDEIIAFHPSQEVADRCYELVRKERENAISVDEQRELDTYIYLEHLMRMLKAEARRYLNRQAS